VLRKGALGVTPISEWEFGVGKRTPIENGSYVNPLPQLHTPKHEAASGCHIEGGEGGLVVCVEVLAKPSPL
jgi:hypothetical protein